LNKNVFCVEKNIETKSFNKFFRIVEIIRLEKRTTDEFSILPMLKAVTKRDEYVILDKINKRNIFVFNRNGKFIGKIGEYGRGVAKFIYPHTLVYSRKEDNYYVYDSDTGEIIIYNKNMDFLRRFAINFFMDSFVILRNNKLCCYSSSRPYPATKRNRNKNKKNIHIIDMEGKIIKQFGDQSKYYYDLTCCEGGGVIILNNKIYNINPYEYTVNVYNQKYKKIKTENFKTPYYTPPPERGKIKKGHEDDMKFLNEFHSRWSHIRQLLKINNNLIGVFYEKENTENHKIIGCLDIINNDLTPHLMGIIIPPQIGGILFENNNLYLLRRLVIEGKNEFKIRYTIEHYKYIKNDVE